MIKIKNLMLWSKNNNFNMTHSDLFKKLKNMIPPKADSFNNLL